MSTYSSFLSNIFMAAYIETESLSKPSLNQLFENATEMIFFPMGHK